MDEDNIPSRRSTTSLSQCRNPSEHVMGFATLPPSYVLPIPAPYCISDMASWPMVPLCFSMPVPACISICLVVIDAVSAA